MKKEPSALVFLRRFEPGTRIQPCNSVTTVHTVVTLWIPCDGTCSRCRLFAHNSISLREKM